MFLNTARKTTANSQLSQYYSIYQASVTSLVFSAIKRQEGGNDKWQVSM